MSSFTQLREESNKIGIEFLMTELDTALTFLDVAQTTGSVEGRARNLTNARTAYETVQRLQLRVMMGYQQKQLFQQKMDTVRKRLEHSGSTSPLQESTAREIPR